jgi:hypothetical protein
MGWVFYCFYCDANNITGKCPACGHQGYGYFAGVRSPRKTDPRVGATPSTPVVTMPASGEAKR